MCGCSGLVAGEVAVSGCSYPDTYISRRSGSTVVESDNHVSERQATVDICESVSGVVPEGSEPGDSVQQLIMLEDWQ